MSKETDLTSSNMELIERYEKLSDEKKAEFINLLSKLAERPKPSYVYQVSEAHTFQAAH